MSGARMATTSMSTMMAAPMAPRGRRRQKSRITSPQPGPALGTSRSSERSNGGFSAMPASSTLPASAVADARVEPRVGDVHEEVDDDERAGHEHDQRLQQRVVAMGH